MSEPKTYNFEVKVLLLKENETWIAQGLEYDITGHGVTPDAAMDNFGKTMLGQAILDLCNGLEPLSNAPEAPQFYWNRFNEAEWRGRGKRFDLPSETPPAYMVSALAADTRLSF